MKESLGIRLRTLDPRSVTVAVVGTSNWTMVKPYLNQVDPFNSTLWFNIYTAVSNYRTEKNIH